MGDSTEMGTLAVTEELHAKHHEAARKEAAARKAPRTRLRMRRAPGNQRPKKGSAVRSSRPLGRAAQRADLVTELDGTPVRDAADLQLRVALLRIGEFAEFAVSRPGGAVTVRAARNASRPRATVPGTKPPGIRAREGHLQSATHSCVTYGPYVTQNRKEGPHMSTKSALRAAGRRRRVPVSHRVPSSGRPA